MGWKKKRTKEKTKEMRLNEIIEIIGPNLFVLFSFFRGALVSKHRNIKTALVLSTSSTGG